MRSKVTATMLGFVMVLGAPGQARAVATELPVTANAALAKVKSAATTGDAVQCVNAATIAPCNKCKLAMKQVSTALSEGVTQTLAGYTGQTASGVATNAAAATAAAGMSAQTGLFGISNIGLFNSAGAATGQASSAQIVSGAFGKCQSELVSSCGTGSEATAAASQMQSACAEGQAGAQASAADKAAKGMTMSEMAQMAGAGAQLLGPLAQMMQGGQKSGNGSQSGVSGSNGLSPYSYTPSSGLSENDDSSSTSKNGTNTSQTSPTSNTKLGTEKSGSSVSAENTPSSAGSGFYTSPNAKSGSGGGAGGGSDSAYQSITSDPSKLSDSLAYGNSGNSGQGYGASFGGSGAGGGMLGGGSGNSSGASKMGDKDAVAKAAGDVGAFEMPGSGGSSRPAFLGLKGGGLTDLSAGAEGGPLAGAEGLESLGADLGEGGGRELASQANDIHAEGEASIFHLVKAKYVEIKKRGNI